MNHRRSQRTGRLRAETEKKHVGDTSTAEDRAIEGGSAGEKARDHHMPRGIRRDSSAALAARAVECLRPEVGTGGGELAHIDALNVERSRVHHAAAEADG